MNTPARPPAVWIWPVALLSALGLLGLGCAEYALGARSPDAEDGGGYYDDDDYNGDDDQADDDDVGDDDDTGPPEDENDFVSVPPAPGDIYVFIVNPNRDSVSKVNVETRQIATIEVGDEPSMVLVTPDYTRAAVFNDGEDSVSVVNVQTDEVATVAVREDFNYMTMSPSGSDAVCFLNTALLDGSENFQGVLSYTEVSIVDLDELVSHDFSVGFNPKQVKFADDGERAIIISDEFITVVDLTISPPEPQLIDLEADPFDPPVAAEVEVEPTGEFAYIRYQSEDALQVVDLDTGDLAWLYAGTDPTDMDLSPDGSQIVVVSRTSRELRTFLASDPEEEPGVLDLPDTETIGSVSMAPVGDGAVLYTTAELTDRITMWDRSSDELTIKRLEKPVDQMVMAPDGESMLAIHTLADTPDENDIYSDHYVMTIITIDEGAFVPNAVLLEDELMSLANFDAGDKAVFMMDQNRYVGVIDYDTRLVDDVLVPSYPVHVGVMPEEEGLPAPVGWVSQDHPLGRISFIEPDDLAIQTVTGFELNSGIE
jgi:DNA-binding beta-propeller fold protein YncE